MKSNHFLKISSSKSSAYSVSPHKLSSPMIKGAAILALAATLSACGSPNQSQTAALDSATDSTAQVSQSSVTQANAPLNQTQTNQPASTLLQRVSDTVYIDANCG